MGRKSLGLIFLGAAVLALYGSGLSHTPPHLHHDEVVISLQSHSIATTGRDFEGRLLPLYFRMPHVEERAWYQPAIVYFTAVLLQVMPAEESTFRFATAIVATIDVILMFLVARRLFGSDRWAWVAAILLAATPTHYVLGRVAFDFIYPLPFILGWLLGMLVYLERREPWRLFVATTMLGLGFYSYIASVAMMPIYVALTLYLLFAHKLLTPRTAVIAIAGWAWPLLLLIPWLISQPSFVSDVLVRYSVNQESNLRFSTLARRVSLYWTFFDPAFLFLMGGYTHLTASTRLIGVFLMPFIVLIPLGMMQLLTRARSAVGTAVFIGFLTAPLAAAMTVQEPYASSRQLPILIFGVLIATYGIRRAMEWAATSTAARVLVIALLALLPLHFAFFMQHYFRAYHGYAAAPFEYNHRGALEAIIERTPPGSAQRIYLTRTQDHWMDAFWRLALARKQRAELLFQTTYFDSEKPAEFPAIPPGALVLASVNDRAMLEAVRNGQYAEELRLPEPADDPVFFVLRRLQ